ncbi:MAG: flagellar biosynthetic protein FliO [Peptococcaceae bacterium]|nr:flagellar biosynthetic protein FliO [Peptococcaceae bacterium]
MDAEILKAAVRIIIALPLVAALAYFLIRHGLARRTFLPGGRRRMRLVEQIPLGPKTSLSLVEVGGRYILLAHSENGFCVVREMDELPGPVTQRELEAVNWKDLLGNLRKTYRKRNPESRIQNPEE